MLWALSWYDMIEGLMLTDLWVGCSRLGNTLVHSDLLFATVCYEVKVHPFFQSYKMFYFCMQIIFTLHHTTMRYRAAVLLSLYCIHGYDWDEPNTLITPMRKCVCYMCNSIGSLQACQNYHLRLSNGFWRLSSCIDHHIGKSARGEVMVIWWKECC